MRPPHFSALAALLLAALGGTQPAAAVPFASLSPKPELQLLPAFKDVNRESLCVLMASGRGISSITAADLAQYEERTCFDPTAPKFSTTVFMNSIDLRSAAQHRAAQSSRCGVMQQPHHRNHTTRAPLRFACNGWSSCAMCGASLLLLRSNNSLTALPDDFLSIYSFRWFQIVDLSRNRFTAAGVTNFRTALTGKYAPYQTDFQLDLSFNDIGPSVPPVLGQWSGGYSTLLLIGCGITDVPVHAFAGSNWKVIDLSLNNLRSGLHPISFSATKLQRLSLSNCNLRSESLVPGVFNDWTAFSWSLHMDNVDANLSGSGSALNVRFPYRSVSPKVPLDPRLLSAAELNPPSQLHTNKVTAARYLESWANFFDPFPVGLFHPPVPEAAFKQPTWSSVAVGGKYRVLSNSERA